MALAGPAFLSGLYFYLTNVSFIPSSEVRAVAFWSAAASGLSLGAALPWLMRTAEIVPAYREDRPWSFIGKGGLNIIFCVFAPLLCFCVVWIDVCYPAPYIYTRLYGQEFRRHVQVTKRRPTKRRGYHIELVQGSFNLSGFFEISQDDFNRLPVGPFSVSIRGKESALGYSIEGASGPLQE